MGFLSNIPYAGGSARTVRNSLVVAAGLSRGFQWLVVEDRQMIEPLREAVLTSDRLKRSRSRRDLPATIHSMDNAAIPLRSVERMMQRQSRTLAGLTTALRKLQPFLGKQTEIASGPPGLEASIRQLTRASQLFGQSAFQVHQLCGYVQACAEDGRLALR